MRNPKLHKVEFYLKFSVGIEQKGKIKKRFLIFQAKLAVWSYTLMLFVFSLKLPYFI